MFDTARIYSRTEPCWVICVTLLSLRLLTFSQEKEEFVYKTVDGIELKLDLYRADIDTAPVVVWIHGGGWLNGSREGCKAKFLAMHGISVASIDYRLTDVAQWPAQIDDCYDAIRYLRKHSQTLGINANKIGVWGGSAGGHLAALVATRPAPADPETARVQALCDWYGPTDLLTMPPNVVSDTRTIEQVRESNGAKLLGSAIPDVPELAKDASAFYRTSPDDPPALIMHGSEDPGVPLEQSRKFHRALQIAGVDSTFTIIEGAGHGGKEFQTDEVRDEVISFFKKHLAE